MEDEAWVVNEVETEDENEEEEEDDEGLGERKREARVIHGSLTMKDLQPATRLEPLDFNIVIARRFLIAFFTFTFLRLLLGNIQMFGFQVQSEGGEQKCLRLQQSRRSFCFRYQGCRWISLFWLYNCNSMFDLLCFTVCRAVAATVSSCSFIALPLPFLHPLPHHHHPPNLPCPMIMIIIMMIMIIIIIILPLFLAQ